MDKEYVNVFDEVNYIYSISPTDSFVFISLGRVRCSRADTIKRIKDMTLIILQVVVSSEWGGDINIIKLDYRTKIVA